MPIRHDPADLNRKSLFRWLMIIILIEGLITILSIVSIPADPKNAFVLGYSLNRLVLLGISLLVFGSQVILFINSRKVLKTLERLLVSDRLIQWIKGIGFFVAVCLWLTIWFPTNRLGVLEATYIRFRPLLLWLELIGFQFYAFFMITWNEINLQEIVKLKHSSLKIILITLCVVLIGAVLFGLLILLAPTGNEQLLSSGTALATLQLPNAPLSSLQLFSAWLLFICLYLLDQKNKKVFQDKKGWLFAAFLLIWISTFFLWNSVPFPCGNDRPGPFLPNDQCYPKINDAVYSIGSHYTALGQGIYNHWLTDKPLYMVFLAIGQWIAGPGIDQYLIFQVAMIALIPSLLFLLGKRFTGLPGGIFLAALAMIKGVNEIYLYQRVESINVKFENPELLAAFFLILLCFYIFKWVRQPSNPIWAAFSAGLLGISSLVRYNPIFIVPILLLVIGFANYKKGKSLLLAIIVFLVTFAFVFIPMILSLKDSSGNSYYLVKIQNVISSRYSTTQTTSINESVLPHSVNLSSGTQGSLVFPQEEIFPSDVSSIFFHFFNNEFSSLVILPVNISLISIVDQVKQPIWDFSQPRPIWQADLSIENILVLILNLAIVTLGICVSVKKFGLAGLSALLIQTGYHIGNAIAKTSGGRYLEPVNWVTLLYFSIGIFAITKFIFKVTWPSKEEGITLQSVKAPETEKQEAFATRKQLKRLLGLMSLFLILGLIIPLTDHLPKLLPEETSQDTNLLAESRLLDNGSISAQQWDDFLNDASHLVIQGKGYHPRYYQNGIYQNGDFSFELMLLGKKFVYVNYLLGVVPDETFADGSDAILVGCQIKQDDKYGAERIIMRSYAVIQLDHEKSMYIDPGATWKCVN
jgi:hypothetical protein